MTTIEETTPAHLRGNGRPVVEERTVTDLRVTGSIPRHLDGRYVRNGANPFGGASAAVSHNLPCFGRNDITTPNASPALFVHMKTHSRCVATSWSSSCGESPHSVRSS